METQVLITHFTAKGKTPQEINELLADVNELESFIKQQHVSLAQLQVPLLQLYIIQLTNEERNTVPRLLNLMRYFGATRQYDLYIYFTSLLNSQGVIGQIKLRVDPEVQRKVFDKLQEPPLGSDISLMPTYTSTLMDRLSLSMERKDLRKALAGNNHEIPKESFAKEKEFFDRSDSLDDYLKDLKQRGIDTLQKHCDQDIIWFEQTITQEVLDYVKTNPEIMSATRVGNKLYSAKIPYDTVNFLKASDIDVKRYYACHCPFIRSSFLTNNPKVDPDWCYCSAGFGKLLYEVLFEEELEVEVLETPLTGSTLCRFSIMIPKRIMEKMTPKVTYEDDRY